MEKINGGNEGNCEAEKGKSFEKEERRKGGKGGNSCLEIRATRNDGKLSEERGRKSTMKSLVLG